MRYVKIPLKTKLINSENLFKKKSEGLKDIKTFYIDMNKLNKPKNLKKNITLSNLEKLSRNKETLDSCVQSNTTTEINRINIINNFKKSRKTQEGKKLRFSMEYNKSFNSFPLIRLQGFLNEPNFNTKFIMEKEFNIFDLEKKVGHYNVLPIMGRIMLDYFGLIDEKICL